MLHKFCLKRDLIAFIIGALFCQLGFSQSIHKFEIAGRLIDSLNNTVPYATICLYNEDASSQEILVGALSDSAGQFKLNYSREGLYRIQIRSMSYSSKSINIQLIQDDKKIDLGDVQLSILSNMLNEVSITAQKKVENHVDRIVFNPDSLTLKKSVSGYDLLKNIPYISVSPLDKSISVMGKKNVLILINGTTSDREPTTIDATEIKYVEIITNPSTRYSSETESVLNIVLKDEKKEGVKVVTFFETTLKNALTFGGLSVEYETGKWRGFVKYNLSIQNNFSNDSSIRYEYYGVNNLKHVYSPIENGEFSVLSNAIAYGLDCNINEHNFLNLTCNYSKQDYDLNSHEKLETFMSDSIVSYSDYADLSNSLIQNQNYSIFYKRKFNNPKHEIWVHSNLYFLNRNYHSIYEERLTDNPSENLYQWQEKTTNNQVSNDSRLEYFYTNNKIKIESGYHFYTRYVNNNYHSQDIHKSFTYNDSRNALYTNLIFANNKYGLQAGFRLEAFTWQANDEKNDISLYPLVSFSVLRNLKRNQTIRLTYNRRLSYPTYRQLVPFEYFTPDSLSSKSGNSNLVPVKTDKFELSYSLEKDFYNISFNLLHKSIMDYLGAEYELKDGILSSQTVNFSSIRCTGNEFSLSIYPSVFELTIEGNIMYWDFSGTGHDGFSYDILSGISAELPLNITAGIEFELFTRHRNPNGYFDFYKAFDYLYLTKRIFNSNAEISLYWIYPFNSDKSENKYWNDYFSEVQYSNGKDKFIGLGFNYFFNLGKKVNTKSSKVYIEHDEEDYK